MMRFRKGYSGILIAFALLVAVSAQAQTTLFSEDFESGMPADWTITNNMGDDTWFVEETETRGTMTPDYVVYDAAVASGAGQSDLLIMPTLDCSGYESVTLNFDTRYYRPPNVMMAFCTVQISGDNGATWDTTAFFAPATVEGPQSVDISEIADDQSQVIIRFGYHDFGSPGDFHWCLDNIEVAGVALPEDAIYSQNFENGMPEDWTITNTMGDDTWFIEETETRGIMTPNYLVYDAAVAAGPGQSDLITMPTQDCSGYESVTLNFKTRYFRPANVMMAFCTVQVSGDNGATWDTTAFFAPATVEGLQEVDISEIADGQSQVIIRFGYHDFGSAGDFHWCLDDIRLTGDESSGGGPLVSEDFENGLPADWSIDNSVGDAGTWFLEETTTRSSMAPNYMVYDAAIAAEVGQVDYLYTPIFDCTDHGAVNLSFDHYFYKPAWTPTPHLMVQVTNDNWTTFDTLVTYGTATVEESAELDLSSVAAGQSEVQVRFNYTDRSQWGDFQWCIDNVLIEGAAQAEPANLLISEVTFSPMNPQPDEIVSVAVTIENDGDSESGAFTLDWFQNATEAPSMGDTGDYTWNIDNILPDETVTVNGTISYDGTGSYSWYFLLDSQNAVVEQDETDNIYGPETIEVMSGAPSGLRAEIDALGSVSLDWFPILGVGGGFNENFNDGTADAMNFDPVDSWTIENGYAVNSGNGGVDGQYNSAISNATYANAFIEKSFTRISGNVTSANCMIVRSSGHYGDADFAGYVFCVANAGYYGIFMYNGDGSYSTLSSWQAHQSINSGLNAENIVSVIAYENQFTLFVNGVELLTVQDDTYSEGYFGVGTFFPADDQNSLLYDYVTLTTDEETILMHVNQGSTIASKQPKAEGSAKMANVSMDEFVAHHKAPVRSLLYDMSGLDELDEFLNYNIYRNDELIGTSTTSSYTDQLTSYESFTYKVTAAYDEGESLPTNEATIVYSDPNADIFIWNPDPSPSSGLNLANILMDEGYSIAYSTELNTAALNNYDKVFVCLGMLPNMYFFMITDSPEETALVSYLEQGGNLYIEAGSVFTRIIPRNLFGYMRVQSVSPGSDDLSTVMGEAGTFTEGIEMVYPPDDGNEVGHAEPAPGAERIFYNPADNKGCGVINDFGYFKTVFCSFQVGDLEDGDSPSTRSDIYEGIIDFFDTDVGIGSLDGTVTDNDDSGAPLSAVEIIVDDMVFDTTGTDGTYLLNGLRSGEHNVSFHKAGYRRINETVTITMDQTTTLDAALFVPSGNVSETTITITVDITPGADSTGSATLVLNNDGAGPLDYRTRLNILESPWNTMYRIASNGDKLEKPKARGVDLFKGNDQNTFTGSDYAKDGSKVCGPVYQPPTADFLDELDELMAPLVQYNVSSIAQTGHLYGTAATPEGMFVTSYSAPYTIFHFDFYGELITTYEFPAEGYQITNDLAYDPNTGSLYGVNEIDSCLYRFTPDLSLLVNVGRVNFGTDYASLAYDYDNNLFFLGNIEGQLARYNPESGVLQEIEIPAAVMPGTFNNPFDGMTYMPSDPDGYTLWLINDPDYDIRLHRYNPTTNEWDIDFAEPAATQWPGGFEATDAYRPGHLDLVMLSQSTWDLVDIAEGYPAPFGWLYMEGESLGGEVGVGGSTTLTLQVDVTAEHVGHELDIASGDMAGAELIFWGDGWAGLDPVNVIVTFEVNDVEDNEIVLTDYALHQNYPNPFNPTTRIKYDLIQKQNVKLALYDVLGREVAVLVKGAQPAGSHTVTFDGSHLASGVYFYRIEAGPFTDMKKLILLK